jgi:hypothetical protein
MSFQMRVRFLQFVDAGVHIVETRETDTPQPSGFTHTVRVDRDCNLKAVESFPASCTKDRVNFVLERHWFSSLLANPKSAYSSFS